ncbi:MAG: phosphoglycerate kinase [Candidatus Hydrothermia bacterium]
MSLTKLTILDLPDSAFKGKRVFVRVDFNVPVKDGQVEDDTRIRKTIPTITYLIDRDARVILASHLGRPKGGKDPKYSLKPVAERLSYILKREVKFIDDCVGDKVEKEVEALKDGEILLLENLRFYEQEEKNDREFSKALAKLCDIYVNDAFATAHRAHASTYGITEFVPVKVAGILMKREIEALTTVRDNPKPPFVVILGGAKVKDKIGIIEYLLPKADFMLIGGGMAYTFLHAMGVKVGKSLLETEYVERVKNYIETGKIILPEDHVVASEISENATYKAVREIPDDMMGVDIGPITVSRYANLIPNNGTLFWNGPLGVIEIEDFAKGSIEICKAVAYKTSEGLFSVLGGGDTLTILEKAKIDEEKFSHVSSGGGATLEFLAGIDLPGIKALDERKE